MTSLVKNDCLTKENPGSIPVQEKKKIQWEEFAISLEEHFHANDLFQRNPNGKPLGHQ